MTMIGRAFRFFVLIPALTLVWGYSNAIGVTDRVTGALDLPDLDQFNLPGVERIFEEYDKAQGQRNRAIRALWDNSAEQRKRLGAKGREELGELIHEIVGAGTEATGTGTDYGTVEDFTKARHLVDTLAVKGKAPMTGYDRSQFGSEWSDNAGDFAWTHNGCDTRNDVLARDLVEIKEDNCRVLSGLLVEDPYTGDPIRYIYGDGNLIDIEHVVALGNTWVTGSFQWTEDKRAAIANDPLNLMAVDAGANRAKGDADAATWLPPNTPYRCAYITRQVAVKVKYDLWVAPAEKDAMVAILDGCI